MLQSHVVMTDDTFLETLQLRVLFQKAIRPLFKANSVVVAQSNLVKTIKITAHSQVFKD